MHSREVHHLADERWFRGKHQFLVHWARPELLGKTTSWVPFMANHKIDANDGIPPAALRSFIGFLGTKGFRICHQTFAENLLLDPTSNA
ncbi:hypothetical protein B5M09_014034 [Aphanomyces astaci]|uniref:Uncharacterized protein n=1 Tax=Aphanomyces astaci TaxID=112090 RepID=A0A3R7W924_APHAT|nr:hypothetical protein B5M09_014034 [Aphanomyces astaci]